MRTTAWASTRSPLVSTGRGGGAGIAARLQAVRRVVVNSTESRTGRQTLTEMKVEPGSTATTDG